MEEKRSAVITFRGNRTREATMTHTSKGELSDLNLTSGQWHYVENASDGGLRQSLGDDNCQGDFAEAIRRELKQRSART